MKRPNGPPYGERPLQLLPVSQGRDVWDLQIKLLAWGSGSNNDGIGAPYMPVRVTGTFDVATRDAVKRFQKKLGNLPVNGMVDAATFLAIDREAGVYAAMPHTMRCPCIRKDPLPIICRCTDHHKSGICTGFGHGLFAGKFLLDAAKLPDGTSLAKEKLDVYDMQEYPGIDKALLWAVRGLMRRAAVDRIYVAAGYRCWQDNYRHTDERRWRHRRATFHFGKSIEFFHDLTCADTPLVPAAGVCARCGAIRTAALELCGFQPRWQEPDRVSVGEVATDVPAPANPRAVHVSTVRRRGRELDDFVKTFADSVKPLYAGLAPSYSLPLNLGGAGLDWRTAPTAPIFHNTEGGAGGWFPIGPNRILHTGIHLFAAQGTHVHAIADGEVVACRAGEAETAQPYGSRNFVLIRHKFKTKTWYSLYMHLDNGAIAADSAIPWRKKLEMLTHENVQMDLPSPWFRTEAVAGAGIPVGTTRLVALPGLGAGEWVLKAALAAAQDPRTTPAPPLDPDFAQNSQVIKIENAAIVQDTYACIQIDGVQFGRVVAADAALAGKIGTHSPVGIATPIPVRAGELVGLIGQAPTDATLNAQGAYLHLEAFSKDTLLTGPGYVTIDATNAAVVADRKKLYDALRAKKLITEEQANVLLPSDLTRPGGTVDFSAFRSAIVKTRSAWDVAWKMLLANSPSFGFMQDAARNTIGDNMEQYGWWTQVSAAAKLPDAGGLMHYHPITLLLQLAQQA